MNFACILGVNRGEKEEIKQTQEKSDDAVGQNSQKKTYFLTLFMMFIKIRVFAMKNQLNQDVFLWSFHEVVFSEDCKYQTLRQITIINK